MGDNKYTEEILRDKSEKAITLLYEMFYQEQGLLFTRFNFFLIVTSFLIGAVAILITANLKHLPQYVPCVTQIIIIIGGLISAIFTVINYTNARIISLIRDHICNVVATDSHTELIDTVKQFRIKFDTSVTSYPADFIKHIIDVIRNPITYSQQFVSFHVWVIPGLFYGFWMIIWGIIFSWWYPVIFTILLLAICYVYCRTSSKIKKGDEDSLIQYLHTIGIKEEDLQELKTAIKLDKKGLSANKYGDGVSHWLTEMLAKAANGTLKMGLADAGNLLTKALSNFFGIA
jgi:hypothetical protein